MRQQRERVRQAETRGERGGDGGLWARYAGRQKLDRGSHHVSVSMLLCWLMLRRWVEREGTITVGKRQFS